MNTAPGKVCTVLFFTITLHILRPFWLKVQARSATLVGRINMVIKTPYADWIAPVVAAKQSKSQR
jgi:hypothetical protein